jgi:hypothetical protein
MIMSTLGRFAGAAGSAAPSVNEQKRKSRERICMVTKF